MTNTSSTPPEEFDLDEYLGDVKPPAVSVDVATRLDLHGKLQRLKRRYEAELRATREEESLGGGETSAIAEEYEAVLKEITDSEVTLYLRALSDQELADALTEDREGKADFTEKDATLTVFTRAIIAVEKPGKPYREVRWPAQTVESFFERIGELQVQKIIDTYNGAKKALPTVDADFLRKSSGQDDTTA